MEEWVYATKIGQAPNDILGFLQSRLEFDSMNTVQSFLERLVHLMNNTREWFLKGYTSTEVFSEEKKSLNPLPSSPNNIIDIRTKKKEEETMPMR